MKPLPTNFISFGKRVNFGPVWRTIAKSFLYMRLLGVLDLLYTFNPSMIGRQAFISSTYKVWTMVMIVSFHPLTIAHEEITFPVQVLAMLQSERRTRVHRLKGCRALLATPNSAY